MDSPLMEELDAICEGKSKLDLAEEIWRLRREIERLRAGWIEADKIALEGRMRPEASLSKATLLYAADIVQGLVRADEAGEIEETLRRLAAPLSDAEAGLLLPGLREAQRIAGSRPDGYEGILERIDELERKPQSSSSVPARTAGAGH